jgi:hypothetical protein
LSFYSVRRQSLSLAPKLATQSISTALGLRLGVLVAQSLDKRIDSGDTRTPDVFRTVRGSYILQLVDKGGLIWKANLALLLLVLARLPTED